MDNLTPRERSEIMSRVKSKDSRPEMIVRKVVHAMGYRYRLHVASMPGKPDLVFASRRKVTLCMVVSGIGILVARILNAQVARAILQTQRLHPVIGKNVDSAHLLPARRGLLKRRDLPLVGGRKRRWDTNEILRWSDGTDGNYDLASEREIARGESVPRQD